MESEIQNKLSLHHMNFSNLRYSSQNGQRWKLIDYDTCLWRLQFPWFFLSSYMYRKVWLLAFQCLRNHFILTSTTHILHKTLIEDQIYQYSTRVETWSEFYLQIITFWILHPKVPSKIKQRISRHFIYKTLEKY